MYPDLTARATLSELMDAPDCDETLLLRTVRQFAAINRLVTRYRKILKRWVIADMQLHPAQTYHLVDMGAGGCDIDVWLLKAARRKGLNLHVTACDTDPRIIAYAQSRYPNVEGLAFRRTDVLSDPIATPVDYVFANHFLHHLTNEQIVHLLRKWEPFVRRRMVFSDLHRIRSAYAGYAVFSSFFPRSFARMDGLISIRRGFLPGELDALAKQAVPAGTFSIQQHMPGRLVLGIDNTAPGELANRGDEGKAW